MLSSRLFILRCSTVLSAHFILGTQYSHPIKRLRAHPSEGLRAQISLLSMLTTQKKMQKTCIIIFGKDGLYQHRNSVLTHSIIICGRLLVLRQQPESGDSSLAALAKGVAGVSHPKRALEGTLTSLYPNPNPNPLLHPLHTLIPSNSDLPHPLPYHSKPRPLAPP